MAAPKLLEPSFRGETRQGLFAHRLEHRQADVAARGRCGRGCRRRAPPDRPGSMVSHPRPTARPRACIRPRTPRARHAARAGSRSGAGSSTRSSPGASAVAREGRPVPPSSARALRRGLAICVGERTTSRAATSSIASGSRSTAADRRDQRHHVLAKHYSSSCCELDEERRCVVDRQRIHLTTYSPGVGGARDSSS